MMRWGCFKEPLGSYWPARTPCIKVCGLALLFDILYNRAH